MPLRFASFLLAFGACLPTICIFTEVSEAQSVLSPICASATFAVLTTVNVATYSVTTRSNPAICGSAATDKCSTTGGLKTVVVAIALGAILGIFLQHPCF